jgi:hypothetical protein
MTGLIAQTHKGLKKKHQTLLNPFQRVFAMSLGIHSEVDYDSDDELNRSIRSSPRRLPDRPPIQTLKFKASQNLMNDRGFERLFSGNY